MSKSKGNFFTVDEIIKLCLVAFELGCEGRPQNIWLGSYAGTPRTQFGWLWQILEILWSLPTLTNRFVSRLQSSTIVELQDASAIQHISFLVGEKSS